MKIALATCLTPPEVDVDEPLLLAALRARGATATMLPWDAAHAADADAGVPDLVVLRSTWNYHRDLAGFLAWAEAMAQWTTLANPVHVVRENASKGYLLDLAERGIEIVPTELVRRGERPSLADIAERRAWHAVVVKPLVSAGSFRTQRFDAADFAAGERFLHELASERDVLLQCWMPAVETTGERSLVWIDGAPSHAVRKAPRFSGGHEAVSAGPVPMADDERAFAARVLDANGFGSDLLYARVDVIRDRDPTGTLRLMELELIEPSLFLAQHPPALDRFADAIVARARAAGA